MGRKIHVELKTALTKQSTPVEITEGKGGLTVDFKTFRLRFYFCGLNIRVYLQAEQISQCTLYRTDLGW